MRLSPLTLTLTFTLVAAWTPDVSARAATSESSRKPSAPAAAAARAPAAATQVLSRATATATAAAPAPATATRAPASASAPPAPSAPNRWTLPREPSRIVGDTWYVGTEGITVLLIRGRQGSILIDAAAPGTAAQLLDNVRAAGTDPADIEVILTSHAHVDHVGTLAELQRATGARVLAMAASAELLARGGRDDIHFGDDLPYEQVRVDGVVQDGEVVVVGDLRITAHSTPAHTPGSTSWSWVDTLGGATVQVVYADSLTAPGYRLIDNDRYPAIVEDFRRGFAAVRALRCDVLITPHPEASRLFERMAEGTLVDAQACRAYADQAERNLERSLATQREKLQAPDATNQ